MDRITGRIHVDISLIYEDDAGNEFTNMGELVGWSPARSKGRQRNPLKKESRAPVLTVCLPVCLRVRPTGRPGLLLHRQHKRLRLWSRNPLFKQKTTQSRSIYVQSQSASQPANQHAPIGRRNQFSLQLHVLKTNTPR